MHFVITNIVSWIKKTFNKNVVNKSAPYVLLLYYVLGLLSYVTASFYSIHSLFVSSSILAVIIRAFMTAIICIYSILVLIVNEKKVNFKWIIIFIYILLFTMLSTAISPQTYHYLYAEKLYGVVHLVQASTGTKRLIVLMLGSISDFAIAFCLLFILPTVINSKKIVLIITLPIMFICFLECLYSVAFEHYEYIKLFKMNNPEYSGYDIHIGATFGNKEDWGSFLTVSFCASIVTLWCLHNKKSLLGIIIRVAVFLFSLCIFVFAAFSLCKTSLLANSVVVFSLFIWMFFYLYKKNKLIFATTLVITGLVSFLFFMFLFSSFLHSINVFNKLYTLIDLYILNPISKGVVFSRTEIWLRLVDNMRSYNLFFGLSKGGVNTYSQVLTVEGQSLLHNGFAFFFGSYGVFGFAIYLILLLYVLKNIFSFFHLKKSLFFILIGFFGAALIFSLLESEVLIMSGSIPIFIFNVLLCSFSVGYRDYLLNGGLHEHF